jgi:hypothetical protein
MANDTLDISEIPVDEYEFSRKDAAAILYDEVPRQKWK